MGPAGITSLACIPVYICEKLNKGVVVPVGHTSQALLDRHALCADKDCAANLVLVAFEQLQSQPVLLVLTHSIALHCKLVNCCTEAICAQNSIKEPLLACRMLNIPQSTCKQMQS